MRRLVSALLPVSLGLALLARAAHAAPLPVEPTDAKSLEGLIERDGCHWASKTQVACIEAPVEMGFVTISLRLYAPGKAAPVEQVVLYTDGSTGFDAAKVAKAGWARAKILLAGFTPLTREKLAIKDGAIALPGRRGTVPPLPRADAKTTACCAWKPRRAQRNAHLAVVEFDIDCRFTGDPAQKAAACFIDGYNDESRPQDRAVVVLR